MKNRIAGLVSVIMPSYNRAAFLPKTLSSLENQTYENYELIFVDDGSDDETRKIIEGYQKRWGNERLKNFFQQHQGQAAARNRALDESRGEFIQFLDSDDTLEPNKFENQIEALKVSGADAAVCGFQFVEAGSGKILKTDSNSEDVRKRLARFRGISTAGPFFRAAAIPDFLRFNPKILFYSDRDFYFRCFLGIREWVYTPGIWVNYVQHGDTISTQFKGADVEYEFFFMSAKDYWERYQSRLTKKNRWMLGSYAAVLAVESYKKNRVSAGRRLSAEAFRFGALNKRLAKETLKSLIPEYWLNRLRQFRNRNEVSKTESESRFNAK